ncbi:hypothetical protein WJX73_002979 [Symbiochloris irregularis]|uniref:Uncharacterized protein n=1 Tax=Symbiochloris irregularis TaxID=706552 RepID=A0AAW1PN44_9CHLO
MPGDATKASVDDILRHRIISKTRAVWTAYRQQARIERIDAPPALSEQLVKAELVDSDHATLAQLDAMGEHELFELMAREVWISGGFVGMSLRQLAKDFFQGASFYYQEEEVEGRMHLTLFAAVNRILALPQYDMQLHLRKLDVALSPMPTDRVFWLLKWEAKAKGISRSNPSGVLSVSSMVHVTDPGQSPVACLVHLACLAKEVFLSSHTEEEQGSIVRDAQRCPAPGSQEGASFAWLEGELIYINDFWHELAISHAAGMSIQRRGINPSHIHGRHAGRRSTAESA